MSNNSPTVQFYESVDRIERILRETDVEERDRIFKKLFPIGAKFQGVLSGEQINGIILDFDGVNTHLFYKPNSSYNLIFFSSPFTKINNEYNWIEIVE